MNPIEKQNKREYNNAMVKDYAIMLGGAFLLLMAVVL